jgi:hypothetical protein
MYIIKKVLLITLIYLLKCIYIFGQSSTSFKLITISVNPFENKNAKLCKTNLSSSGNVTFDPAILFSAEFFGDPLTAIKFNQAAGVDCALKFYGFSQIMIKRKIWEEYKNSISIGFGPVVHYRNSWKTLPDYVDEEVYSDDGDFQYKISWFSGEIEYNHYFSKKSDLCISINHIHRESFGIAIGFKYWISKQPSRRGCISCPSFKK